MDDSNKRKKSPFSFLKHQRRQLACDAVVRNFWPINISLWLHGVGYTEPFCWGVKNVLITTVSLILSGFFDIALLYYMLRIFVNIDYSDSFAVKDSLADIFVTASLMICRFCLYYKRRRLRSICQQVAKLYAFTSRNKPLRFCQKLLSFLVCFELFLTTATCLFLYKMLTESHYASRGMYFFGLDSETILHCDYVSYAAIFWCDITAVFGIYFYFISYVIKKTVMHFQRRLHCLYTKDKADLFQTFEDITSLIASINQEFQTTFLWIFVYANTILFYYGLFLAIYGWSGYLDFFRVCLSMTGYSFSIILICLGGSLINKAIADLLQP